ncbi:MAG: pyridoxal-phosphate dependent enzyme [Ferruginibacter sp.]|nr:pyridoxal-phosphate dependent enzyme [Ferruginibacter sp.]
MIPAIDTQVYVQPINNDSLIASKVSIWMARFDLIHPIISGNKLYKLYYWLKQAVEENKQIETFGGYFSNHLVATAYACKVLNIPCTGYINGERPNDLSHTMKHCEEYGMQLKFLQRDIYKRKKYSYTTANKDLITIPEGGFHPIGMKGATLMRNAWGDLNYTHICVPVGSATTLAGILYSGNEKIIAIPALKNMTDIPQRLQYLYKDYNKERLMVWPDFHFGGFAKAPPHLIKFIHDFFNQYHISLDKVYTAKMMAAIFQKIETGWFKPGSKILCLHTGGLQGNGPTS